MAIAAATMIEQVRRFNRTVTQRVGALDDSFLATDRPLGEARVLWEIGPDGSDVRLLRSRLDLDAGYLSRILRSLADDGLVEIGPDDADRRVRAVRLTAAGAAQRSVLNGRADDRAASILGNLDPDQQTRLVSAMAEVERLLLASSIRIDVRDPREPQARACARAYAAELARRFDRGYDADRTTSSSDDDLTPPHGLLLVATLHSGPVGCGALVFHDGAPPTIKRLWVDPGTRGLGLGRRLMAELEARAVAHGATSVRLETNRTLTEAIALYRSTGYVEAPAFSDEPYAHHWFVKDLAVVNDPGAER